MDDLISRQAAIRWVKTECNPYGKPTLDFESGKKVIEHLEQMPSAQPQRLRGRWVETERRGFLAGAKYYKCNICAQAIVVVVDSTPRADGYNYCPRCGSEMKEG